MFAPVNTPQGAAPAPPTLQTTYNTIGTALSSLGYACTWIGKWHLSAYGDAGSSTVGYNGPSDYGFGESSLDIPNLSAGSPVNDYPLDNTYPSPDGLMNEGVGGRDLHDESIASGYRAISPQTFAAPPYYQLRDGAIADAFVNYFLATANLPTSPWFTAVSFVNPHDMSNFPYAYGLTTGNFSAPTGSPLTTGYDAPPTAGWDSSGDNDYVPPLSTVSPYGTSAPSDFQGVPWNYQNATITGDPVDDPISLPYATLQANGQYGKPGLQAYQENQLNVASGSVNNEAGWITFLNYYYWMQACVDAQIGRVIGALQANNALWQTTDIIFTSDHGEYAGSHNLHAKGAGLYDEAMNVPLFVSYPPQRMGTGGYGAGNPIFINDFLTSSVDILPFLYTLAAGNEDWRSESGNLIYYLRHRESIADAIYAERTGGTPAQRRVVNITVGENTVTLPYILHTFDEDTTASIPGSGGTSQPSHAIGFRTFAYNGPSAYAGGGKLGIYSYWPSSTTECSSGQSATSPYITSETPQQFEFYDYTNGSPPNYGEVGNQALVEAGSSPVLTAEAAAYLAAFESIQNSELYNFFSEFYSSYTAAYDTYLAFAGLTGWCYTPPSGGA